MHAGRNFEYISGEDPAIGVALLPSEIAGVQQNAMAIVKHYIGNTQETGRADVNELVDEQLLMELYGPPFATAVQQVAGVMCAYNLVNGKYACENPFTLKTMLKGRYNFSGFVVSGAYTPERPLCAPRALRALRSPPHPPLTSRLGRLPLDVRLAPRGP